MDALNNKPLSRPLLLAIAGLLALAVVPHAFNLNLSVAGFFYSVIILRLLLWPSVNKPPSRWLLVPLTLLSVVIVLKVIGYSEGRQFGVALLVMMLGLKIMEMKTRRDLYISVLLGYFVLITLFLYDKGMLITAYALLLSSGFTAVLYAANQISDQPQPLISLKKSSRLILGAMPVMLLLFVFFPRLDGPLWSLNLGKSEGVTGMSDNIRMGSISSLSLSEEVAFRVKFSDGRLPPAAQRYWRGMVLLNTDGKQWTRRTTAITPTIPLTILDQPYQYTVTMEPSGQRWLFPLDRLVSSDSSAKLSNDYELSLRKDITSRYVYQASATLDYWVAKTSQLSLQLSLQLPENITKRMRQLVNKWKLEHGTDQKIVAAALQHFNQQPYVYTLQPPKVEDNPVDQFMFDTRRGFCEHYATSFVTLMRMAGIPSRVVIGYQGGELNPRGGHLIIRQSDAHAWAEVWLKDGGWTRIDPTAAVAPERIEMSVDPLASASGEVLFRLGDLGILGNLLRDAGWLRDNLELQWHHWVIGYNHSKQSDLLDGMGLGFLSQYERGLVAVFGAFVIAGLLFLLYLLRKRERPDPLLTIYKKYQQKLSKAGLDVTPWIGPMDLATAASKKFPTCAGDIKAITQQYISLRYGRADSNAVLVNLRKRVGQFRPHANKMMKAARQE